MPREYPQLQEHTLRCANGALYLVMALAVVAATIYAIVCGRLEGALPCGLAGGGCALALLWAGYYMALSYRVCPQGVSRRLVRRRFLPWHTLRGGSICRQEERGVMLCRITLKFEEATWCISSELFDPEAVQVLASALESQGVLPISHQ